MEEKNKNKILYILIAILIIGIIIMGILMVRNKKDNVNGNQKGKQEGMEMQQDEYETFKIPEISMPDDGKGIVLY